MQRPKNNRSPASSEMDSSITHRPEMAHGNGKSNGERSWAAERRSDRVTRGKDGHHQYKGDYQLDAKDLSQWEIIQFIWKCITQVVVSSKPFENSSASDCTDWLHYDVQNRPNMHTPPQI